MAKSPRRFRRAGALALVAVLLATVPGGVAEAETDPWNPWPPSVFRNDTGAARGTLVIGDSNMVFTGAAGLADHLRFFNGRDSYVNAAVGGSWMSYSWPGQGNGNAFLWQYALVLQPSVTVIGLGGNDASVLTTHPGAISLASLKTVMKGATQLTLDNGSGCVLLVNNAVRSNVAGYSAANLRAVNTNMAQIAAEIPGGRVRVADWNSYSAGKPWFGADIHFNSAGFTAYRDFIVAQEGKLRNERGC